MAISKRLRFEILRRDNHACRYCGASAPDVKLVVDHVIPVALGGTDEPSNLVTACEPCNSGKSATPADAPMVADVQADALRWAAAMQRATEMARATMAERALFREDWRTGIWGEWTYEWKGKSETFSLPDDWENTIDRFVDAGIGVAEFTEAVRIAMTKRGVDHFKYMCGVLWRMVDDRQQVAMQIVSGEDCNGA